MSKGPRHQHLASPLSLQLLHGKLQSQAVPAFVPASAPPWGRAVLSFSGKSAAFPSWPLSRGGRGNRITLGDHSSRFAPSPRPIRLRLQTPRGHCYAGSLQPLVWPSTLPLHSAPSWCCGLGWLHCPCSLQRSSPALAGAALVLARRDLFLSPMCLSGALGCPWCSGRANWACCP